MTARPDPNFFIANRERLRTLFSGTAPIVLTANGLVQRNGDATYPFRQDSTFWYFTGIDDPDVILVMDRGKEYLITPKRDEHRVAFDGEITAESLQQISGIQTVYEEKIGWKHLGSRIKRVKHVATVSPPPAYIPYHGLYTNPARSRLLSLLKEQNEAIELLDLRQQVTRLRMIKQTEEIGFITQAVDHTAEALRTLTKNNFKKYDYEYEVEATITAHFRMNNIQHAYQPIVAAGKNACTLHYIGNNSRIHQGSQLLLDVGAEVHNYAADVTRTYFIGEPTKRYRQVYEAVLDVQRYAMEKIVPGMLMKQYEEEVEHFMGEKLRELGLIKSIDHETVRHYYPHATSHFLGLDVHDIADYERPLEPGVVLTVEPGIYIPEEGIGIRIEDDVHLTENGLDILTSKIPSMLE